MTFAAVRTAPEPAERVSRQRAPQIERCIRLALAAGIAIQVAQRFLLSGHELSEYGRSLWYVSYEFGFIRRGLAGEVLRIVGGGAPSLLTVDLTQNAVALLMLAAATALVVLLCRQRTVVGYATAALLVVAPFGFDSVGGQRRPDLLGFLVLALIGIWGSTRRVHPIVLAVVGGGLLAVTTFVSEVSPLIVGPWLILCVGATARASSASRATSWLAMTLAGAPSMIALAVLASVGQGAPAQVAALEQHAPPGIRGHGSVFAYLDDTVRESLGKVVAGPSRLALSVLVGAVLCGLMLFCVRAGLDGARTVFRWILPTRVLRTGWMLGTLAGATVLFALGLDWLRWITSFSFAGLLAAASIVILLNRSAVGPPEGDSWRQAVPARLSFTPSALASFGVAIYLVLLPPLSNWVRSPEEAARLFLDIPG